VHYAQFFKNKIMHKIGKKKGITCCVQAIRTNNLPKKKQGSVVALLKHFISL
jgi:hypothetical protein